MTPSRCHNCNRVESPDWRRGPDGTRTLCSACGFHYAKTSRKFDQKQVPKASSPLRESMAVSAETLSSPTVRKTLFPTQDTESPTQPDRIALLEKELEEKEKLIGELRYDLQTAMNSCKNARCNQNN